MPEDADIAQKAGSPCLAAFLRSSVDRSQRFNLCKARRMQLHRIIDNRIPNSYSKLKHESEGYGRDRVLVITKRQFDDPSKFQKRHERKQKHQELLSAIQKQLGCELKRLDGFECSYRRL